MRYKKGNEQPQRTSNNPAITTVENPVILACFSGSKERLSVQANQ